MFGTYRIAVAVPVLRVGNPEYNAEAIGQMYSQAVAAGAALIVTPELSISGYSCGDLFEQEVLLSGCRRAVESLARQTAAQTTVLIVGFPCRVGSRLFNAAAVLQNGRIVGVVPKSFLPNYREFYEKRYFTAAADIGGYVDWSDQRLPFGNDLVFQGQGNFALGVEICEDLWAVAPPSNNLALNGATLLCNLYGGPELVAKSALRRQMVTSQSLRLTSVYVLAGAGVHESTSDLLHAGHALIAANGKVLAENRRFERNGSLLYADIRPDWLALSRRSWSSFNDNPCTLVRRLRLDDVAEAPDWQYFQVLADPFIPSQHDDLAERCEEILSIQTHALARRLEHSRAQRLVLGLSGGLDSTLALLVCVRCCDLLGLPRSTVLAVTMPGFGTSGRTKSNALALAGAVQVELREICIAAAVQQHFADIGHDPSVHNATYENSQARERTQILMDLANDCGGLVVGTGDLSEIALGWCTFNGDQMSMYGINASVPKTLVRFLVEHDARQAPADLAAILRDINATPVSPELLPGEQHTELILGNYRLHDFFLYYFLRYAESPEGLAALARHAFAGVFSGAEIDRALRIFLQRFFSQQFKRNSMPDGPKVGSIALSPRGDWRMPADADATLWLARLPPG